ncbi:membrane protein [Philodulcilactobacillus myokoensis]|uniref:Membrane protein n=1 Tax=Philodulcilactobacillus myokoensis TaxID=2929573 RepID=A0A9W6B2H5_9LACO|nr:PrsW family glutamic-type intramembrane protease [Philodulcilactobacillus myokoensis]GLB47326.1 membrane protein [Philodulcilactobacillus myokoensis]
MEKLKEQKNHLEDHLKRLTHHQNLKLPTALTGVKRNYDRFAKKPIHKSSQDIQFVEINFWRIFAQVFKRHSSDEADRLLLAGTKYTTPSLKKVSSTPVEPWLFSRFFVLLGFSFTMLTILFKVFGTDKAVPGMNFIGSLTVPFSLLIMFYEMNTYRNISVRKLSVTFLVGGIASLLMTMLLYDFIPSGNGVSLTSAFLVGLIEESGKMIIIIYFINHYHLNYILNGMLIGAAVGAGFAVFETAGYANEYGLITIFVRSWQAIGTHTIWSAIVGSGIILAKTRHYRFNLKNDILDLKFIEYYFLAIFLHAMWDWNIPGTFFDNFYLQKIILILIGWIAIFILLDSGLREVRTLQGQQIVKHGYFSHRKGNKKIRK